MNIRSYLCREAAALTDASLRELPLVADWPAEQARRRAVYLDWMGLTPYLAAPRTPLNLRVTGTLERDAYTVEKLYFESLPQLYVTANLYVPRGLDVPAPAVLYLCGHSRTQKIHYQSHPRRWAELGFVALVVDTIQYGEIRGEHHGTFSQGRFHWYSRGYSPAAVECWNGIRALDLSGRPVRGRWRVGWAVPASAAAAGSVGGWLPLTSGSRSPRLCAALGLRVVRLPSGPSMGTATAYSTFNPDGWDLADVGALIAPRPLVIASADRDGLYTIASVRETYAKLRSLYETLGAGHLVELVETPGRHSYHETSRTRIFSRFLDVLADRVVPPEDVGDLDASRDEPDPDVLRVFVPGTDVPLPAGERSTVIDDEFVSRAVPVQAADPDALDQRRAKVIAGLRSHCFGQFPAVDAPLELDVHLRYETAFTAVRRFRFTGEPGWRLTGLCTRRLDREQPHGLVVVLRSPDEVRSAHYDASLEFAGRIGDRYSVACVDTRGCGESAWGQGLSWHVRRAAMLLGRTVASMRVYDALRALEAVRQLSGVDADDITLAARGEMAVVALCAALLDGHVKRIALAGPPATLNQAGAQDGTGPAIELWGALKVTDLPEMAALLWPAELDFVGWRPESYRFAEEAYRQLGEPGVVRHLKRLEDLP